MGEMLGTLGRSLGRLASTGSRAGKGNKVAAPVLFRETNKIGYLSQLDIFVDLSHEQLTKIETTTKMTTCKKGKVFYRPNETGEVLFLLKRGKVQVYRLASDGRKLIVGTIDPGTFFGEMSLIGQGMHRSFAEAVEDCLLCVMSRADVERLLQAEPRVAIRILEAVGRRLIESEMHLEEMAYKSVPARLAALLLRLGQRQGGDIQGLTHQDLAEMVGTYRETATTALNEFRGEGLIHIERKRITILDPVKLQRFAEE